jgi:hypothetical protein
MSKQLMDFVLPRLAKQLYNELQRYRAGSLDESQFSRCFERLLQGQHAWLIKRGVSDEKAALALHGAVLVLSKPGLKAEAAETGLPLEVVEFRAIRDAAADVASNYSIDERKAVSQISRIVARYSR